MYMIDIDLFRTVSSRSNYLSLISGLTEIINYDKKRVYLVWYYVTNSIKIKKMPFYDYCCLFTFFLQAIIIILSDLFFTSYYYIIITHYYYVIENENFKDLIKYGWKNMDFNICA